MIRLRGGETVIVGIQPDVAFAMVQVGLSMGWVITALDLEEGLEYLHRNLRVVLVGNAVVERRLAAGVENEIHVPIASHQDLVVARHKVEVWLRNWVFRRGIRLCLPRQSPNWPATSSRMPGGAR